jgi:hypothetical protein
MLLIFGEKEDSYFIELLGVLQHLIFIHILIHIFIHLYIYIYISGEKEDGYFIELLVVPSALPLTERLASMSALLRLSTLTGFYIDIYIHIYIYVCIYILNPN